MAGNSPERDAKMATTQDGATDSFKRKRHRRGKKRKWAKIRRGNRAPYNTTQFLMEDQNIQEPDLEHIANGHRHHRESNCLESSDEFYSSPEDEEEFLQKEFSVVYDNIHAERLSSMSKSELIQEYLQLEDRVDKLEQKLKSVENCEEKDWEDKEKVRIFEEEIRTLSEVNERLREENKLLKIRVKTQTDDNV